MIIVMGHTIMYIELLSFLANVHKYFVFLNWIKLNFMFFLVFVSCVDGLAYFEKEISRYTVFNIIVLECMHVKCILWDAQFLWLNDKSLFSRKVLMIYVGMTISMNITHRGMHGMLLLVHLITLIESTFQ